MWKNTNVELGGIGKNLLASVLNAFCLGQREKRPLLVNKGLPGAALSFLFN
jgi:hypothetical protein